MRNRYTHPENQRVPEMDQLGASTVSGGDVSRHATPCQRRTTDTSSHALAPAESPAGVGDDAVQHQLKPTAQVNCAEAGHGKLRTPHHVSLTRLSGKADDTFHTFPPGLRGSVP